MNAPNKCPICGAYDEWKLIDTTKKGFSAKKALIGGVLLGGIGVVAGISGKKKSLYQCVKCGFIHEYDGEAEKEKSEKEFKNSGLYAIWISTITKATPLCQFCGQPQDLKIKNATMAFDFKCEHCQSVFRCDFSFSGKVKSNSTCIIDCGDININNFNVGKCDASLLIKDLSLIK